MDTLYTPDLCNSTAVYRLEVGSYFYIGSSTKVGSRRSDHLAMLGRGEHPNRKLQEAWHEAREEGGEVRFVILEVVRGKKWDSKDDGRERAKHLEQLELDKCYGQEFCCNVSKWSTGDSTVGERMAKRWTDPAFRERTIRRLRESMRGRKASDEAKRKMSEAKKGASNHKSLRCWLEWNGERREFDSVSEAAVWAGCSQQVMDQWMRGVVKWPSPLGRAPRSEAGKRLMGITGGTM